MPARGELRLEPEFLERLCEHTWPGNVRELENAIRRAVALSPSEEISADLQPGLLQAGLPPAAAQKIHVSDEQAFGTVFYGADDGEDGRAVLYPGMKLQEAERVAPLYQIASEINAAFPRRSGAATSFAARSHVR